MVPCCACVRLMCRVMRVVCCDTACMQAAGKYGTEVHPLFTPPAAPSTMAATSGCFTSHFPPSALPPYHPSRQSQADGQMGVGATYAQNCRSDGAVAWMFSEMADRALRFGEDGGSFLA